MNQERKQPAPDAYVIGGPSDFAEDVHRPSPNDRELGRNEIGLPNMSEWDMNHKDVDEWNSDGPYDNQKQAHMDKEAARDVFARIEKKAYQCVKIAQALLPTASNSTIEEQAYEFMSLPDSVVVATCLRLADAEEQEDGEEKELEAYDDKEGEDEDEKIEAMLREMIAEEDCDDEEKEEKEATTTVVAKEEEAEEEEDEKEASDEDVEALIDEILMEGDDMGNEASELDIDMGQDSVDRMAHDIQENDEVLKTLFDSPREARQASKNKGVASLGGRVKEAASQDEDYDLSKLWQSAPDVSDIF
jgi:hypothetical protein